MVNNKLKYQFLGFLRGKSKPFSNVIEPNIAIGLDHDGELLFLHVEEQLPINAVVLIALWLEVYVRVIALELLYVVMLVCVNQGNQLMHFLLVLKGNRSVMVESIVLTILSQGRVVNQ